MSTGQPTEKAANSGSSIVTIFLGMLLVGGLGFAAGEWRNRQQPAADFESVTLPENALRIPKELEIVVGEPKELRAETRGKKVMWLPLEKEVRMVPIDSKAVWVWANEVGDYRVIGWTAVNGLPTPNQITLLHVKKEAKGDK